LYVALLLLEFQDDLYNWRWRSYSTLNRLKWKRNEKVRSFESRRGPKKRKNTFCELKSLFFLLLFFSLLLFICTSTMISRASGSATITFQITQIEALMMKI
jgi:uncharacterized membrane protein (DUF485 family)